MSRRRLWTRGVAAALVAGVALGCSGDDQGAFDDQVADARAAIESGDHRAASEAFDALAGRALAAHDEGRVSDAELEELRQLIDSGRALLDEVVAPPPSTSTSTTTSSTTEPPPPPDEDDDKDDDDKDEEEGENKGKGKDKDD